MKNNPRVTVAPSTRMGKPIGATVEGIARQLTDEEWEVVHGGKKPSLWGRMWHKIYQMRGRTPVYFVITAA